MPSEDDTECIIMIHSALILLLWGNNTETESFLACNRTFTKKVYTAVSTWIIINTSPEKDKEEREVIHYEEAFVCRDGAVPDDGCSSG